MFLAAKTDELRSIMELFYNLSGIRIVIFDSNFREIIAHPSEKCAFCREIRSKQNLVKKCAESDTVSFENCKKNGDIVIYKCHAGLVEATLPLSYDGINIGYVMFGQITDIKNKEELCEFVRKINKKYGVNCSAKGLKYRNKKQIAAAAKLLEICTEYIILKEMVVPQCESIAALAKRYISVNLCSEIKISDICAYAKTNRSQLYAAFSDEYGIGISAYIRNKRLEFAYGLLKKHISVSEAAEKAVFNDYIYFSRLFKKKYLISPYKIAKKIVHKT